MINIGVRGNRPLCLLYMLTYSENHLWSHVKVINMKKRFMFFITTWIVANPPRVEPLSEDP